MKVILTKETEYDFNGSKYTAIPHDVFTMLVEKSTAADSESISLPKVIVFNDKDDYVNNAWRHDINMSKDVFVSAKGQIFCFIGNDEAVSNTDVATDTEENS